MRLSLGFRKGHLPLLAGLVALGVGFGVGLGLRATGQGWALQTAGGFAVVGELWVNALRMTLVPLVVSLLASSVLDLGDVRALGRLGSRSLLLFLGLLLGSAVLAAVVGPLWLGKVGQGAGGEALLKAHAMTSMPTVELPTLKGFLLGLVPAQPLKAAVDGAMLPLIFFTLAFALAATRLPEPLRTTMAQGCRALRETMLLLVRGVLVFTPLGVFGLSVALGAGPGLAAAGALGRYVLVLCGLLILTTLALYPLVGLLGGGMLRFAKACLPAQAVALGTRSSLASLPALIEGYRTQYGERPGVTGFVLPLSVSTFKLNTPVSDLVGPLFLAALYGAHLTAPQIATMTLVAVAMSFSNPGIPSGGLFVVTAPVMMSVGLPLEGIGLLIAVDAIPDILATFTNVTGDMAVAALMPREGGAMVGAAESEGQA